MTIPYVLADTNGSDRHGSVLCITVSQPPVHDISFKVRVKLHKAIEAADSEVKNDPLIVIKDEHPRASSIETLAKLKGQVQPDGTVTTGNASGVNDAAALLLSDEANACQACSRATRSCAGHGDMLASRCG